MAHYITYTQSEVTIGDLHITMSALNNARDFRICYLIARSILPLAKKYPTLNVCLEDTFLQTFLDVVKAAASKGSFPESWLQAVISNTLDSHIGTLFHSKRRNPVALLVCHKGASLDATDENGEPLVTPPCDNRADVSRVVLARDELKVVRQEISKMPLRQRLCMEAIIQGASTTEIAEAMGVDDSYVRRLVREARQQLRLLLQR